MTTNERQNGRSQAAFAALIKVPLLPLFFGVRAYYWFAAAIAEARSDLKPSLPAAPVSAISFDSDEAAARALIDGLLEAVPDAREVTALPDWARDADSAGGLRGIALSSPQLDAEQVLISWDAHSPGRTFVWMDFEGLASAGPIEWPEAEDLREDFWTAVGMLRDGVHYQPDRRGRVHAWIFVAEADGWVRWGVDRPLGDFEPRWFRAVAQNT